MLKLYMTKGLPASGKTTWTKEMLLKDSSLVRVNKDDLRAMLHGGKWSKINEKQVVLIRDDIIENTLAQGRNIIVDDTNLHPKHRERFELLANRYNAELVIQDFTDVPLDVCISRDSTRSNSVGKKVIVGMHQKYLRNKNEKPLNPLVFDNSLPYCVIFDLDGTLAHITDRSPYDGKSCASDLRNDSIVALFQLIQDSEAKTWKRWSSVPREVIILSGRNGDSRPETEKWLTDHGITYDKLYMRTEGDSRKDAVVKKELFEKHIVNKYNVLFIVDDRDQMVELWRSMGITCLQCNYGDF